MGSALILQSINFVTFERSRGMFMANGRLKLRISQNRKWSDKNIVKLLLFIVELKVLM